MIESWSSTLDLSLKICLRHWMVYRKNLLANISPTLSDPVFFILAFGFGMSAFISDVGGRSYLEFMVPGLAAGAALITSFFDASYGAYFRLNFEGTYKAMLTSPIGVSEIIIGEFIWMGIKGAAMSLVVSLVVAILGYAHFEYLWLVPIAGAFIAVTCSAIGLISTTLVKSIDQFQTIYSLVIAPIYFLSGIFFPVTTDLGWVFWAVQISPLYHGARLIQSALWAEDILAVWCIHLPCLLIFALLFVLWARRRFSDRLYLV